MRKVTTKSLEETYAVAKEFTDWLTAHLGNQERATIVALEGDLGAGKTAFTQGVAKALGIAEKITSPTFVLMKQYWICMDGASPWLQLHHIDAYRFDEVKELEPLRFAEILTHGDALVLLEWPERVAAALPQDTIPLHFTFIDETTREITLPYD